MTSHVLKNDVMRILTPNVANSKTTNLVLYPIHFVWPSNLVYRV